MMIIPLEIRPFKNEEHFQINVVLATHKCFEIAIINLSYDGVLDPGIGTITCDKIDPNNQNPNQILYRFAKYDGMKIPEYYKLNTFNLRSISLHLEGVAPTPIAITLGIRICDNE